jgi:hypothetical protein
LIDEGKRMNERKISDLQLASYLVAREFRIVGIEGPPHRRQFVFANVPDDVIVGYYSGTDLTSARKLFSAYRDLKGLAIQSL